MPGHAMIDNSEDKVSHIKGQAAEPIDGKKLKKISFSLTLFQ